MARSSLVLVNVHLFTFLRASLAEGAAFFQKNLGSDGGIGSEVEGRQAFMKKRRQENVGKEYKWPYIPVLHFPVFQLGDGLGKRLNFAFSRLTDHHPKMPKNGGTFRVSQE
jgi:hypothetical protein